MNTTKKPKPSIDYESSLIKYFVSLDIESIPVNNIHYDLLTNIYNEIKLNPQQIILNEGCKTNLEILINKSSTEQLYKLLKYVRDPVFCIKKYLGAKTYESILNKILSSLELISVDDICQLEKASIKIIKIFYKQFLEEKSILKELIKNKISTYSFRIYFKILNVMFKQFENEKIKEDLLKKQFLITLIDDLEKDEDINNKASYATSFTILEFIKLFDDEIQQEIYAKYIKKLKVKENIFFLEDKSSSYFYQTIVKLSNQENLNRFYKIIEPNLLYLIKHETTNYIISEFAKHHIQSTNSLYELLIENGIDQNSNIYISLSINALKNKNDFLIKKVFAEILPENFLDKFINEGSINKKYLEVFSAIIYAKINLKINLMEEIEKRFEFFWLETEKGIRICIPLLKTYPEFVKFVSRKLKERKIKENVYSKELLKTLRLCKFKKY